MAVRQRFTVMPSTQGLSGRAASHRFKLRKMRRNTSWATSSASWRCPSKRVHRASTSAWKRSTSSRAAAGSPARQRRTSAASDTTEPLAESTRPRGGRFQKEYSTHRRKHSDGSINPCSRETVPLKCQRINGPLVPATANGIARRRGCCLLLVKRAAVEAVATLGQALAKGRRPPANPLMLHGAAGVGKSHLAAALIKQLSDVSGGTGIPACARSPAQAGMPVPPRIITSRVVAVGDLAREADTDAQAFADCELVDCDLLVLEDVQLLPPRHASTVTALLDKRLSRRKATVATASVGPAKLKQFPRKLTSRLAGGLVVHLEPLSPPSRRNFLE